MVRGNFKEGKGQPVEKYSDYAMSCVRQLNWFRCHLGFGLRWAKGTLY